MFNEKQGIVYFAVTSDGTTGEEWIKRLENKGVKVRDYVKNLLLSKDFNPTSDFNYEIAILKGELFGENERMTKNIREEAEKRRLSVPNAEVACLIREKFSDEEIEDMGLFWIIVMHEPIEDSSGYPVRLGISRSVGASWLGAFGESSDDGWSHDNGLAFVVS